MRRENSFANRKFHEPSSRRRPIGSKMDLQCSSAIEDQPGSNRCRQFGIRVDLAQRLPIELFPGEYLNFNISLEAPPDFSLERTSALTRQIEARLLAMPESDIRDFNTIVGLSVDLNYDRVLAPNLALLRPLGRGLSG